MAEVCVTVAALVVALAALIRFGRVPGADGGGRTRWVLAVASAYAALVGFVLVRPNAEPEARALPRIVVRDGYVSSSACRSCHPAEYASWHRSFHRTMTQDARGSAIAAPRRPTRLELDGRGYELSPEGGAFEARMPDPDAVARLAIAGAARAAMSDVPEVTRPIVMVTGSHHYQAYWVPGARGNELRLFPFVYLLGERRWVPRRDVFLQPPDAPQAPVRWNSNCVQCHAVAGRPKLDAARDVFATEGVELGIACEACHGPGGAHVARMHDPLTRYRSDGDPAIVNPARLDPAKQSEICGQCHAYFVPLHEDEWWSDGFATRHRAGVPLDRSRRLLGYADRFDATPLVETSFDNIFWADGTVRIGGRDYNGLVESPCYRFGKGTHRLSCLSCHSVHRSEPDDQLAPGKDSNAACTGCHAPIARDVAAHTHHAPASSGSLCYGCHMPYTTYALLKGIRAHRVTSPDVEESARTGRPNACNLCHLDKTLAWTGERLHAWYGLGPVPLSERDRRVSSALLALLAGDAAQRAIAAYAMGLPQAQRASGGSWPARYLLELLDDPYAAVRAVAARSLVRQPGYGDFTFDFTADADVRRARRQAGLRRFSALVARRPVSTDAALLFDDRGGVMLSRLEELMAARDDRPVVLSE